MSLVEASQTLKCKFITTCTCEYMIYFLVRDDPKLLCDSGEVPKPKGSGCNSIPTCEIVSLLDGKLAKWSRSTSCVS